MNFQITESEEKEKTIKNNSNAVAENLERYQINKSAKTEIESSGSLTSKEYSKQTEASTTVQHRTKSESLKEKKNAKVANTTGRIAKTEPTSEESRLAKLEREFEKDRAVLAKTDPEFAKNKFWDIGHAEGEEREDEIQRIIKYINAPIKNKLLNGE